MPTSILAQRPVPNIHSLPAGLLDNDETPMVDPISAIYA
jgi:hypothetical protein